MTVVDTANVLIKSGEIKDATVDLLADLIEAIQGNPVSVGKVIYTLEKMPFLIRESLFWSKMEKYLKGVYVSEEDRSKLRAKLVEDGSSDENAKRLLECIDRAETTQKIRYLINATRCLLADFIDRTTFFRICRAITGTIDEDLLFVRDHILENKNFEYSQAIQGLFISGLVTFSVIGGEPTQYAFTPLAEDVDRFAISYDNVDRYPDPTAHRIVAPPRTGIPTATVDQVQEMLDLTLGKTEYPKIDVEIPMGKF